MKKVPGLLRIVCAGIQIRIRRVQKRRLLHHLKQLRGVMAIVASSAVLFEVPKRAEQGRLIELNLVIIR